MRLRLLLVLLVAFAWPAVAQARPAPVTWCGTDETIGDRIPELELSAQEQIRFVYVVPSDGPDRFLQDASGIATDAAWIDQWWQTQDPTRTPRFDRYPFPNCPAGFGQLDIGFDRLSLSSADVASLQDPSLQLDPALAGVFPSTQKTIVYYDGPTSNPNLCGETDYLSDTTGGDTGIAYVYLQACGLGAPGSGGTAVIAAHELTHNLGAVPDNAPHECPDNPNHVCDSTSDLMYPYVTDGATLDSEILDVGHDDYYGEGGGLWDVQTSSWLEHLPQFPFALTVGAGGTVSARAGLSTLPCDTGCDGLSLDNGTQVTLIAVPAPGYALSGWSGGCSGAAKICTVAVGAATSVGASFARAPLKVSVSIRGKGTVARVVTASSAKLTAKPARGWRFAGWAGACSGKGTCTLTRSGSVRAVFVRR